MDPDDDGALKLAEKMLVAAVRRTCILVRAPAELQGHDRVYNFGMNLDSNLQIFRLMIHSTKKSIVYSATIQASNI